MSRVRIAHLWPVDDQRERGPRRTHARWQVDRRRPRLWADKGADAAPSETSAGCALGGDRRRRADGELRPLGHVRLDSRARRRHLPHQPRRPGGPRQHGPGAVVHGAGLGAARHRLRAADGLSGQATAGRPAPPAGGRRGAADRVARTSRPSPSSSARASASATGAPFGRVRSRARSTGRWRPR